MGKLLETHNLQNREPEDTENMNKTNISKNETELSNLQTPKKQNSRTGMTSTGKFYQIFREEVISILLK